MPRGDWHYRLLTGIGIAAVLGLTGWLFFATLSGPGERHAAVADTRITEHIRLAEQGVASAQFNMGLIYKEGLGVDPNEAEALKWFRKAAAQKDANAQNQLGLMYLNGRGVLQDYQEALEWFRKAAEQGLPDAQYQLGLMFRNGIGVAPDKSKAYVWFNLAAAQGNPNAATARDSVSHLLTHAELVEAQSEARKRASQMKK